MIDNEDTEMNGEENLKNNNNARTSLAATDGHLLVPSGSGDNISASHIQVDPHLRTSSSYYNTMSSGRASPTPSQTSDSSTKSAPNSRQVPRITCSLSADSNRTLAAPNANRSIYPRLPYSPYSSPTASPRLPRQPTKESRSVSFSDNDGYTQLNQYILRDEIGKVYIQKIFYLQFQLIF